MIVEPSKLAALPIRMVVQAMGRPSRRLENVSAAMVAHMESSGETYCTGDADLP